MKQSVLIVCVNYNSYEELKQYLLSVDRAANSNNNINVDVVVADNSTNMENFDLSSFNSIDVQIVRLNNPGYLGGAQQVINNKTEILSYDYVAISNVDITLNEDFFMNLSSIEIDKDVAWIAPKIYSECENRDRNPKILSRYSKKILQFFYYMYKYPVLFYLYTITLYKRKKNQPKYPEMDIYAGHGSFMLLTRSFFDSYKKIDYPVFLFGEELYMAELVRLAGKKVRYIPSLVIKDKEHASTSTLRKILFFQYNRESIKYCLEQFYK